MTVTMNVAVHLREVTDEIPWAQIGQTGCDVVAAGDGTSARLPRTYLRHDSNDSLGTPGHR